MSLATRCPACGTVFRVVQDQLRVSEGWVRCGRCAEVFNAVDRLVDLEAEHAMGVASGIPREPRFSESGSGGLRDTSAPMPWDESPSLTPTSRPATARETLSPGQADHERDLPSATLDAPLAEPLIAPSPSRSEAEQVDLRADPPEQPAFVRQADRAARWRRSPQRAALAGAVMLAAGALAAQVALEYRDPIAARWGFARGALEQACRWTGCTVEAPRMIEALVVDSSGLVRVDKTAMYRLSVVLRNRAAVDLAAPSIDLSLTDAQGRVTTRRVLSLAELGLPQKTLPAGSEVPLKAVLTAAGPPVTGYTIDIFYP
jgi:predicted Zn finger-like uncharacterized protein